MRFKLQRNHSIDAPGPKGSPTFYETPTELRTASAPVAAVDGCSPHHGIIADNGEPLDWDLIIAAITGEVLAIAKLDEEIQLRELTYEQRVALEKQAIANIQRGGP